uniref:Variant surface glycoprotein 1003 n=1 Tax=Trypanosoma brucei TaxID=5691 RepID=M4SUD1_9TRYP|nr:variant surface glycoprotein 1003 [Trypanosoma brucei]
MARRNIVTTCILLITVHGAHVTQAAEGIGLKNSVWQPICQLSEELGTLPGFALDQAIQALNQAKKFDVASKRAAIYAAMQAGTQTAQKATLLKDYYARLAARAYNKLTSTAIKAQFNAATKTAYLKGRLDDYLGLLAQSTTTTNNACLLPGTANANGAVVVKGKTIGGIDCKLRPPDLATKTTAKAHLTNDGYPNLVEGGPGVGNNDHQPSDGTQKCKLLSAHNTNGYADSSPITAPPKAMAGYLTIPIGQTGVTLETKDNLKTADRTDTQAWYEAFAATKGQVDATDQSFVNETGDLDARPTLQTAITALLITKDTPQQADITAAATQVFGDKADNKRTDLENTIDNTEIPGSVIKQADVKRLGDISNLDTLSGILSHYELKISQNMADIKKQLAALNENKTEQKADCEKIKKAAECIKNGHCKWEGGEAKEGNHCKLNATTVEKQATQAEKDGATGTNTADCTATEEGKCDKTKCDWNAKRKECKVKEGAAVISAVIKAPLLLAFLLLLNFYELFVEVFFLNFINFMRFSYIAQC